MPDFPPPGVYHIKSLELDCYAGILKDQNVLRGGPAPNMWHLSYTDFSKGLCVFSEVDGQGSGSLGVYDDRNNMPVYRVDISQIWVLKKTDVGIAICKVVDDKTYAWYLGKKDEPVVIEDSTPLQSWEFLDPLNE
ncbi:hypothetical protein AZE42_10594 [Rhizopogon vesiculosus]|uniref:Ricin B lectin domain-containing protein n=1 Tax=Rhizopogon vesiculosus TaxID=180088 RepID=A0A1J8QKU7_9AGAM|nr:hypothetical protein AZE42_10594 [Rhizopogon vesiculosus]